MLSLKLEMSLLAFIFNVMLLSLKRVIRSQKEIKVIWVKQEKVKLLPYQTMLSFIWDSNDSTIKPLEVTKIPNKEWFKINLEKLTTPTYQ